MVRLYVTENSEGLAFHDGGLTIFMVGMIAASISMMAIVIFACAKSSAKRKNKNNPYSDGVGGGDGNRTFVKTVVIGENKVQKTRATPVPVRSTGEILVSAAETATTVVDIPSTDGVCNNNNDDCVKDTRCHGGHSSKNNDVSTDRTDNNNNMGASHTHVSANNTTSGGDGHHHDNTSGNTGGGWSNDHGGSSWGGGDHGGGGFSGGGDTGGFSGGGW